MTIEDKTHWDKQLDEAGSKPVSPASKSERLFRSGLCHNLST